MRRESRIACAHLHFSRQRKKEKRGVETGRTGRSGRKKSVSEKLVFLQYADSGPNTNRLENVTPRKGETADIVNLDSNKETNN